MNDDNGTSATGFDYATATPAVQTAVHRFIHAIVFGGDGRVFGGGPHADAHDCRQELQRLGCSDAYIAAAVAYGWEKGNAEWQRRNPV